MSRFNPYQVALVAVCVVTGLLGLLLPESPSKNVPIILGPAGARLFWICMLVSAATVLIGLCWVAKDERTFCRGLRIEAAGLYPLAGCTFVYAMINLSVSGIQALAAGLLIGGCGLASLVRAREIRRELAAVKREGGDC